MYIYANFLNSILQPRILQKFTPIFLLSAQICKKKLNLPRSLYMDLCYMLYKYIYSTYTYMYILVSIYRKHMFSG